MVEHAVRPRSSVWKWALLGLCALSFCAVVASIVDVTGLGARPWYGWFVVTYAVLMRRVLDFEFVLSRTLTLALVSIVIVAAFVILEFVLGTVLAGVSHATGLLANGALALALGLSLRYVHRRIDHFVDRAFFKNCHEDERALRDFSKEAAFVTDSGKLLD